MKIHTYGVGFVGICALSFLLCAGHVQAQELPQPAEPSIGIERVVVATSTEAGSLMVDPEVWSTYSDNITQKIEFSLMDTYSPEVLRNIDLIQSVVLDAPITIKPGVDSVPAIPVKFQDVPYKDTYTVRVRIIGNDGLEKSERESKSFAFGNTSLNSLKDVKISTQYLTHKKKIYDANDGPLIAKTGELTSDAMYIIGVKNTNKKDKVSVSGNVTYVKFNSLNPPQVVDVEKQIVNLDTVGKISVKPVIFSEAGTYVGHVHLTYTIGDVSTVQDTEFRYMLGDLIVNVIDLRESHGNIIFDLVSTDKNTQLDEDMPEQTVESDNTPVAKKDLTVYASYVGQDDVEIGSDTQHIMHTVGEQQAVLFPIDIASIRNKHVNLKHIAITIQDGDAVLYKNIIPFALSASSTPSTKSIFNSFSLWLVIVLLGIAGVYFMYGKERFVAMLKKNIFIIFAILLILAMFAYVRHVIAISSSGSAMTSSYYKYTFSTHDGTRDELYPQPVSSPASCTKSGYKNITLANVSYITEPSSLLTTPFGDFEMGSSVVIQPKFNNAICSNNPSYTYFYVESVTGISGFVGGSKYTIYTKPKGVVGTYAPLNIQFETGFYGIAHLKGYYINDNVGCGSRTGSVEHFFRVAPPPPEPTCMCGDLAGNNRRTNICSINYGPPTFNKTIVSSTPNAPECAFKASCSVSLAQSAVGSPLDTAVFTQTYENGLGIIASYVPALGYNVSNPYTKSAPQGTTTSLAVNLIDSYDGSRVNTFCSIYNPIVVATSTKKPKIGTFTVDIPVVSKGKSNSCVFRWATTDMDTCTVRVNSQVVSTSTSGSAILPTTSGLNMKGLLTCVSKGIPPAQDTTMSTSTSCEVVPEVMER
jgi:hypothetical protein